MNKKEPCRNPSILQLLDKITVSSARQDERIKTNSRRLDRIDKKVNTIIGLTFTTLVTVFTALLTLFLG